MKSKSVKQKREKAFDNISKEIKQMIDKSKEDIIYREKLEKSYKEFKSK